MSKRKLLKEYDVRAYGPSGGAANIPNNNRYAASDPGILAHPRFSQPGDVHNLGNPMKPFEDEKNHFDGAEIALHGLETLTDGLIKILEGVVETKDRFKVAYNNANITSAQKQIIKEQYAKLKNIEKIIINMAKESDNLITTKIK
jgi:hypothetical protein